MKILNKLLLLAAGSAVLVACGSGSSSGSSASGIQYTTLNYSPQAPGTTPQNGLTGIRGVSGSTDVYITGNYVDGYSQGTLYVGPISGGGTYYLYNYPSTSGAIVAGTNVYSADNGVDGNVLLTGSYTTQESGESHSFGFYYDGPVANNPLGGVWQTLVFPSSQVPGGVPVSNTIPHSIMGGLIVGNYLTPVTAGNAFIYNIESDTYESLSYPGARYTTAYGIWWNGGESYTIAGGYSDESHATPTVFTDGFVVDYNVQTKALTNWTGYRFNNEIAEVTHFEGITTDGGTGYNLAASGLESASTVGTAFVHINRNSSGGFESQATWVSVWYPGAATTTADTVYQNYLLGVYSESAVPGLNGYAAAIPGGYYN